MFNTENLSQSTKDSLTGILWFIFLIPLSMTMHYLAKYYEVIWYTIMGWLIATLGAIHLGFAIARGGKRLFKIPLEIKTPLSN